MKTLFPKQRESVDFLKSALTQYRGALDGSVTGVGKTVVACQVARELGVPVAVICPKIVIPQWERELAETGVTPLFVTNYEKIKRGNNWLAKIGKKLFRWQVPTDTLIIWDEAQKCKSPFSQNSQMLVAAKQAGCYNLLLSATACQDPTEMRAIGFVLGQHALNKAEAPLKSWFGWMMEYGCRQDPWKKWVAGPMAKLRLLNGKIYGITATKLTTSDLPFAFADNRIITEPLAFAALKDIAKFYEQHGVTPEIVERYLEDGGASPHVLVEILLARQLAEAAKVPDIIEMVRDAVAEGYSVVVFVNFVDTVRVLSEAFMPNCSVIVGGQKPEDREEGIQKFQRDEHRIIIANIAAGGAGVSLHDVNGNHPRMSLISPTFDEKAYTQTLGRIHRVGAKSPATQKVLIASGTIEEKILKKMEQKRLARETLHAKQDACPNG